jgi:ABC-type lipoprotein release transport system permease subunit
MRLAVRQAVSRLRARRRRTLVAAAGVAAAGAMLGAAVTVAVQLGSGFDRTARRAHLPDVIARFQPRTRGAVDARIRGLPGVAARSYRLETTGAFLTARGHDTTSGVIEQLGPGPRGYALVAGRNPSGPGEAVIDRGLADAWRLRIGETLDADVLGAVRIVGLAVAPDNVAYPLASVAHVYVARPALGEAGAPVNMALLWLRSPRALDPALTQAREVSYGVSNLRFVTRAGVRALVDRAAGIVIALLVGFSLVSLVAAGALLAASAQAEVQRRLPSLGVQRALGFSRATLAGQAALEGALVALPAGALGLAAGWALSAGATSRLLRSLNQLGAGGALAGWLGVALAGMVALVAAAAAWPAWRAAGRPPVELLRGAELTGRPRGLPLAAGRFGLGLRLAAARRARAVATAGVLSVAAGVVLLLLALASLLLRLENDPGAIGRRYQLTAQLPPARAAAVRQLPGVAAAAPRYEVQGADSFALGEPINLVAFPGDHTRFEAPPLASGRRVRGDGEAEVGTGLADALGVGVGGALAVGLPSGGEVRFRVVGTVRAVQDDGRLAYVRPARLLGADPYLDSSLAVRLKPAATEGAVRRELSAMGAAPEAAGGATAHTAGFLGVLGHLLRVVAFLEGGVCLYLLVQTLSVTTLERRSTMATLRALGARRWSLALVLAGAAAAVAAPAAVIGTALERLVLGPAVAHLASGYAPLELGSAPGATAVVWIGLLLISSLAALLAARRLEREPVIVGLREE